MKPAPDPAHLAWIHTLPCAVHGLGCLGPIQAHHVRRFGERKDGRRTIPLCRALHLWEGLPYAIHRIGRKRFEMVFELDIEDLIRTLNERWRTEQGLEAAA